MADRGDDQQQETQEQKMARLNASCCGDAHRNPPTLCTNCPLVRSQ